MSGDEVRTTDLKRFTAETLNDFRVLVEMIGIENVLNSMDETTFWILFKEIKDTQ